MIKFQTETTDISRNIGIRNGEETIWIYRH